MIKLPQPLHLLHGGDYNPDQWLEYPQVLAQDILLMKQAHINCVSLGIFSWAKLEPEEGVYAFGWLKEIIQNLYENRIYTLLATPTGGKPNWMSVKYEEIRRVGPEGQRHLHGGRHNHCYTSPVYREKTREINRRLATEFSAHPGVVMWHLSNEYNGVCYCPLCIAAFRGWLKEKYGTLEKLNHEWWANFWGHTYTDWEQIFPPMQYGEHGIHALTLDWKRFVTHQTVDFMKEEISAIRGVDKHTPVTTNLMGFYKGINYSKFGPHLDIVSWDNYPTWHSGADELSVAVQAAMTHDLMRGIRREPFLMMESAPSMTNGQPACKLKRPGMHVLSSLQAVAHGSNSVQYFQWRKSRGCFEKHHGAVVGHDGTGDTKVFRDVQMLGGRLDSLAELAQTTVNPQVALLFDWENRWALEDAKGPRNLGIYYQETLEEHYRCFWEMGIDVDILDMEHDISRYKLIVAPLLYMYRGDIGRKLREFVAAGGVLVGTYWSGVVTENDLCFLGDSPGEGMAEVFGITREEMDALYDGQENHMVMTNRPEKWKLTELCELIHAKTAKVMAVYGDDYYKDMPALTCNTFGKGEAWYLAAKAEQNFLRSHYHDLADRLELRPTVIGTLPKGVTVNRRVGEKEYFIFQNYTTQEHVLPLQSMLQDVETGKPITELTLPVFGCAVLVR